MRKLCLSTKFPHQEMWNWMWNWKVKLRYFTQCYPFCIGAMQHESTFSSTGCCSEKALQIFYKRSVLWMVPTVDRESIILWKKFEEIDIQFNPTTVKPCQMFIWVLQWNNLPKWFINHRKCLKTADIHDALEIGVCRLPPID